jgi:pyruvate-ferredoxin/flavodoxin oxidoreductase
LRRAKKIENEMGRAEGIRFGPRPIRAPYLISQASFVACHQFSYLERFDVTRYSAPGSVFLLNSIYGPAEVW